MKYIAYCRKSTDEPDRQILSIEAQIAEVKEFAQREHLEIKFLAEDNLKLFWRKSKKEKQTESSVGTRLCQLPHLLVVPFDDLYGR